MTLVSQGAQERSWSGLITRISPVDDPGSRTMMVFVEISQATANPSTSSPALAPGTFLSARVASTVPSNRIILPSTAVKNDRIWVVDENNRIQTLAVDVAFPIQVESSGNDRRLVLETALPERSKVLIHAGVSPSIGTEVDFTIVESIPEQMPGAGS